MKNFLRKNQNKNIICCFLIISVNVIITGCFYKDEKNVLKIVEKIRSDKNINKIIEINDFYIKCSYMPKEFLAYQELATTMSVNNAEIGDKFLKKMENFSKGLYFELTICKKDSTSILAGLGSQEEYSYLLEYLTYKLDNDFYALNDFGDTIKSINYNYINSYGASPQMKFVFLFSDELKKYKVVKIIYSDNLFGLSRENIFEFLTGDITKSYLTSSSKIIN
jgi:hypothetical protein